jgi:hypothetical protein
MRLLNALVLGTFCAFVTIPSAFSAEPAGVKITELTNRLRVEINGKLFTEYYFKDVPRPFCYPLIGPDDAPLTRNFPMRDVPGEDKDHPHHRSLWYAHGSVNGIDFWSETPTAGKIVHEKFLQIKSGKTGVIQSRNKWVAKNGDVVCEDERTLRIYSDKKNSPRMFDFEITLFAPKTHDIILGDTKEGSMAVRVAKSMQLLRGDGHIVLSTGIRDKETWGKRADWCDYYGPVNGKTVGIAIFDHPKNPRHPTWWHVRDYGLFAANPFGVHDFEKKPKGEGDLTVAAGKKITFRYRFVLHEGDEKQAEVQKLYEQYSR